MNKCYYLTIKKLNYDILYWIKQINKKYNFILFYIFFNILHLKLDKNVIINKKTYSQF